VASLPFPRACVFSSFLLFAWWPPVLFLVRFFFMYRITLGCTPRTSSNLGTCRSTS
jgi:hypothetical protein